MASGKETPRQKMIGMMYLVLTALLALNISKDVLEAFALVNDSIETTVSSFEQKNELLYDNFKTAYAVDPVKVKPFWERAEKAKELSAEMQEYIDSLKTKLIVKTEKVERSVADTLNLWNLEKKDDYDIPTNILIGNSEDGSDGLARELKDKIVQYKSEMEKLVLPEDKEHVKIGLETNDVKVDEQTYNWEMYNFYHTPLVATVTILSKLQNDVKNAEFDVVNSLLDKVTVSTFPVDTIAAKVLPKSNYVLLGDEYEADIFVAAFSTTKNPDIVLGELNEEGNELVSANDSVPTEKGMGKMKVPAQREGLHTYEGMVKMRTANNEVKEYPFKSEYIVARPSLVVAPTQLNVFYRGVKNPVDISVPGIPSENLSARITGSNVGNKIRKVGNGKYEVELSNNTPYEVDVVVTAELSDGSTRNMGKQTFRTKRLPAPFTSILGRTKNGIISKAELDLMDNVGAMYDNSFPFGLRATVKSYKLLRLEANGNIDPAPMTGNKINGQARRVLDRAKRGDRIIFEEIDALGSDGVRHEMNSLMFTVR